MKYSIQKQAEGSFDDVVFRTKTALAGEGFGILTETDVKATLKKKLNVSFDEYVILGACNPPFALEALRAEKEIGLFLPCNVIVYKDNDRIFVSAVRPTVAMGSIGNANLVEIAKKVENKLEKVISNI